MFRKTIVLAMALGLVAAVALPVGAGANWKHGGQPIQQNVQLAFTGTNVKFESQVIGGGLGCQVTSEAQLKAGQTTGTITSFKAHPTSDTLNCFGTGGLAFCQIHNLTPQQGIQWVIHTAAGTTLSITHGDVTAQLTGGFCPLSHFHLKAGTIIGTADAHKVSTITLTGIAWVIGDGVLQDHNAAVTGLLHLEQTPTYEI